MSDKNASLLLPADARAIAQAARVLQGGGLVAVPTETVYGLAARADDADAVARIFSAKGRPDFNPLIVHVARLDQARMLARFDARAEMLAAKYWPGPLTLVLPLQKDANVAPAVTAGLATIAIRMPAHPMMRALLEAADTPLAAPSANRSGAISPTTAAHVAQSLGEAAPLILDGGACARGVESTIVALRAEGGWEVLRPGPVSADELQALLGAARTAAAGAIEAPGQLASHYAPGKPVRLNAIVAGPDEFLIGFGPVAGDCSLSPEADLARAAARLYSCLHEAAASPKPRIAVAPVPESGIGAAINDRLRRAAA